jgi:glycosyltransferase involved in cell wall biosynthesis
MMSAARKKSAKQLAVPNSAPVAGKFLCLNMIVKSEMANLERCLTAIAPYVTCWVIGDTGSTDGTQDYIKAFFAERGIPGELHSFPFENFAQARNEALNRARASRLKYDYLLFTDADMEWTVQDPKFAETLTAAAYRVIQHSGVSYWNNRLLRRDVAAEYKGVTHEYLDVQGGETWHLEGVSFIDHATGSNRVEKYERDARLLLGALAAETDPGLIARYTFYLANTYRDAGHKQAALQTYLKRAQLGHWYQEVFISLHNVAKLKEEMNHPADEVLAAYAQATAACPSRAEALHAAARFGRNHKLYERGYQFAADGLRVAYPTDALFIENWIYEYGLLDELAINAYWTERYDECVKACDRLLSERKIPLKEQARVRKNKAYAVEKLEQSGALPPASPGSYQDLLRQAREKERIEATEDEVIQAYAAAAASDPTRADVLYWAARYCRMKGLNDKGCEFATRGLAIPRPEDSDGADDWIYEWGLQEELSIVTNYSHEPAVKDRGFAACNWLALNRTIPDDPRNLAISNIRWFMTSATDMMPSFSARRIDFVPPDGYRATNPSIVRRDGEFLLVQRAVNYLIDDRFGEGDIRRYAAPDGEPIKTRNFLLRVGDDFAIRSSVEILPPVDMPEPAWPLAQGFEDMRPFLWRNQLWGIACVRELSAEGWCDQVLARIDDFAADAARLTDWRILRPGGERLHEKNWMPIVSGDDARFVYLCDPTRFVDHQARTVSESIAPIAATLFRGGSQAVEFDGGRLALVHEARVLSAGQREYRHRFVWFDQASRLRRVSRPFFFHRQGVEFAAGLAWRREGEQLVITYGIEDSEAWIATVEARDVRRILEDAENLPSGCADAPGRFGDFDRLAASANAMPDPAYAKATRGESSQSAAPMAETEQPQPALTTLALQPRPKISGYVISYNRSAVIETCLRSLRFVDELIVVDKSSTDDTVEIARRYADRVVVVPWTPTVEDTRDYALSLCSYDWIIYLDDDECLSPAAIEFILEEGVQPRADVYSIPRRNYFLGRFDPRTRDWPDYKERFFRKGTVEFRAVVHSAAALKSTNRHFIPADSPVFIYHLHCASVSVWVEKTNRYTSQPQRESWFDESATLSAELVRQRTDYWFHGQEGEPDEHLAAYALLHVAYDMVDRVKRWEREAGIDGERAFAGLCQTLNSAYDALGEVCAPRRKPSTVFDEGTPPPLRAKQAIERWRNRETSRVAATPYMSSAELFRELAPFLSSVDSPVDRREGSRALDAKVAMLLSDGHAGTLPQINCFYEVMSEQASHSSLVAATQSMRSAGHPVRVWTYSPEKLQFLAPHGVELRDASDVVSREIFERVLARSEIRYFSDVFRYAVLYEYGGLWMDTDVVMLRPFPFQGDFFFNLQWRPDVNGRHFVCGNVIYAKPYSRHMRALYEQALDRSYAEGWEFGEVGPKLLSDYIASAEGAPLRQWLSSPMLFNTIDWTETDLFEQPVAELADYLNDDRVVGVHLWNARTHSSVRDDDRSLIAMLSDPAARMPSFTSLADRFNTDKNRHTGNRHCYARVYDRLLGEKRFAMRRLMEIGLCRGLAEGDQSETPSVALWQSYFPFCHVVGVDLTDFSQLNNPGFTSYVCDQSKREDLRGVASALEPGSFDVIIDDGSHASADQQLTLLEFWPLLANSGWYFIEDLDWQPPGEDRAKMPLTKDLLREVQHGCSPALDPLRVNELAGQIEEILFFDSHYELARAALKGGLVAIRKRCGEPA